MSVKNLIIKGDEFQAAQSAADHGVPFTPYRGFYSYDETGTQTFGQTTADENTLNNWLIETMEAPYPTGALLWWGYAKT